jgi:hypothetical protein
MSNNVPINVSKVKQSNNVSFFPQQSNRTILNKYSSEVETFLTMISDANSNLQNLDLLLDSHYQPGQRDQIAENERRKKYIANLAEMNDVNMNFLKEMNWNFNADKRCLLFMIPNITPEEVNNVPQNKATACRLKFIFGLKQNTNSKKLNDAFKKAHEIFYKHYPYLNDNDFIRFLEVREKNQEEKQNNSNDLHASGLVKGGAEEEEDDKEMYRKISGEEQSKLYDSEHELSLGSLNLTMLSKDDTIANIDSNIDKINNKIDINLGLINNCEKDMAVFEENCNEDDLNNIIKANNTLITPGLHHNTKNAATRFIEKMYTKYNKDVINKYMNDLNERTNLLKERTKLENELSEEVQKLSIVKNKKQLAETEQKLNRASHEKQHVETLLNFSKNTNPVVELISRFGKSMNQLSLFFNGKIKPNLKSIDKSKIQDMMTDMNLLNENFNSVDIDLNHTYQTVFNIDGKYKDKKDNALLSTFESNFKKISADIIHTLKSFSSLGISGSGLMMHDCMRSRMHCNRKYLL